MLTRVLGAALPAILAGALSVQLAHADIYTWVDASGTINVSNLAPPEAAHVTNVIRASAPVAAPRDNVASDAAHQAEVQALTERVGQLEGEVEFARRQAPPPDFRPMAMPLPPLVQYVVDLTPPPVQYTVNVAPPVNTGCDPTWAGCGLGWIPGFYPASVIVLGVPSFRPSHPFHPIGGGHELAIRQPFPFADGFRRG